MPVPSPFFLSALLLTAALAGCAEPPLPDTRPADAPDLPMPQIAPLDALAVDSPPPRDPVTPDPDLQARGDALRNRADAVRDGGA